MRFKFWKKIEYKKHKKVKVGLALGGGASRGIAHIGAIKAFEENNIEFDFIAGTSVGSIIGAMYAGGKSSGRCGVPYDGRDVTASLPGAAKGGCEHLRAGGKSSYH